MKRLTGALILALSSFVLLAAEKSPEDFANSFFETYIGGDGWAAIDGFFKNNPLILQKKQQLQLLKSQLTAVEQVYGKPFGHELVLKEVLTPSLQRYVYISKHEYHPVTWEMYFYKPKDTWLPDQLLFVDQYQVVGAKR